MDVRYSRWTRSPDSFVFVFREMNVYLDADSNTLGFRKTGAATTSDAGGVRVVSPFPSADATLHDEPTIALNTPQLEHANPHSHTLHTRMLLAEYGVWITEDDLTPRGAFEHIPAAVSIYGFALSPESVALFHAHAAALHAMDVAHSVNCSPLSLYHGTDLASAVRLLQGHDVPRACPGMLGRGFYLGSFFKACRFAARTQDYTLRKQGEGVVMRARAFVTRTETAESHKKRHACVCDECAAAIAREPFSEARKRMALLVDHASLWRQAGMKAVHLGVSDATKLGPHRGEFGGHYMSRHDEWCIEESRVMPCDVALLDFSSIDAARYNPLERSQRIL